MGRGPPPERGAGGAKWEPCWENGLPGRCWAPGSWSGGLGGTGGPWGRGCSHATGEAGSAAQPTVWPSPAPTAQPASRACSTAALCEAARRLPGEGARRAQGEAGLPPRPSLPRGQGPKAREPARAHPFPSLYIRVHLHICPSTPGSAAPSAPTAAVSKPDSGPGPSRETRGGREAGLLHVLLRRWPSPPALLPLCPCTASATPTNVRTQASPELLPPQNSTLMLHCRPSPPPRILAVRAHHAEPPLPSPRRPAPPPCGLRPAGPPRCWRLLSQSREVARLPVLSGSVPAPPQWAFPRNSLFFPGRAPEPGVEGGRGSGSCQCQLQSPLT